MKFNFYEEQKIRDAVECGVTNNLSISSAIWYAAVYYTQLDPITNKKELFNKIVDFVSSIFKDFKYEGYVGFINGKISKARNHIITNIQHIIITESEMDKIINLNDQRLEKLAFVILALAKYENARSNSEKDTFYAKIPEIFRFARLAIPKKERNKYLHIIYNAGIISMNFSIGYNAITVGCVSHDVDDPVALKLDENNYIELAYTYLNYKKGGYKKCESCGRLIRIKKNTKYCKDCSPKYEKVESKIIKCIDCGDEFIVSSKCNNVCRCRDCQNERNKILKSEQNKRAYELKKTKFSS